MKNNVAVKNLENDAVELFRAKASKSGRLSKEILSEKNEMLNKIYKQNLPKSEEKSAGEKGSQERLGENRMNILQLMKGNPEISIPELSKLIGISTTAIENNIRYLKEKSFVKRSGTAKGGFWKVIGE